MQRPPGSGRPLILSNRSINEWISRVAQKHREFTSLELSEEKRNRIRLWVDVTFVFSTLALEGVTVTEADVARAITSANPIQQTKPEGAAEAIELLEALRLLRKHAESGGSGALLSSELLLRIHGAATGKSEENSGDTSDPARAVEHLPANVENACRWFSAESFAELNPIEQASIVHLRLLETRPFEEANQRVATLAASLFTLRLGLPPVIIGPNLAGAYLKAIEGSRSGNTQPMVELMAAAAEESLGRMIALAV